MKIIIFLSLFAFSYPLKAASPLFCEESSQPQTFLFDRYLSEVESAFESQDWRRLDRALIMISNLPFEAIDNPKLMAHIAKQYPLLQGELKWFKRVYDQWIKNYLVTSRNFRLRARFVGADAALSEYLNSLAEIFEETDDFIKEAEIRSSFIELQKMVAQAEAENSEIKNAFIVVGGSLAAGLARSHSDIDGGFFPRNLFNELRPSPLGLKLLKKFGSVLVDDDPHQVLLGALMQNQRCHRFIFKISSSKIEVFVAPEQLIDEDPFLGFTSFTLSWSQ